MSKKKNKKAKQKVSAQDSAAALENTEVPADAESNAEQNIDDTAEVAIELSVDTDSIELINEDTGEALGENADAVKIIEEHAIEAATDEGDGVPELDAETLADLGLEATAGSTGEFATTEIVVLAPNDSNLVTDIGEIENVLEAIIFAAPKAVTTLKLKNLLRSFSYDVSQMSEILEGMMKKQEMSGFQLLKVGGGYQYRTHPKHAEVMQKMLEDRPAKLSPSALEVLSIIAYKQPITRAEIDSVRGVDSGHLMKGLLEKNLIRTNGHAETAGRPLLYGTAPYFLEVFGLNSLDDLPALDEMNRELVSDPNSGGDDALVLAVHPGDLLNTSGLAANPDRGNFDDPIEESFEQPDFGVKDRALEN